ncbi:hypothetical protein Nepgr_016914 [Nepenthes gracilis]|uniref:Transaldolase n=1 Tax=Nepenthes gracilis TaxID=150966 RepID=A0AAD3XS10_NEPGR|nr:hypothetical protein Nepgr_016914 [Nepenthes gracilis]
MAMSNLLNRMAGYPSSELRPRSLEPRFVVDFHNGSNRTVFISRIASPGSSLSTNQVVSIRPLVVRCSQSPGNGTPIKRTTLHDLYEKQGQSPCGVRGVTSNPAIFQKAISSSDAYNEQFRELTQSGKDIESAYWELVIKDIQDACKLFEPIYDQTDGGDGYVSVEVSPRLADDTKGTVEAAKWLHNRVNRSNVYIKIPATAPCVPSIKETISNGISVNVTLIFSLARYEAVIDAYLDGLEASGLNDLSRVTSVASFFVSRVDTLVDKMLEKIGTPEALDLRGKAAVSQAILAYQLYQKRFSGPRWEALAKKGAKKQRLLWASTSVKNPAYPDTLYVDPLIGPDTVSTMPDQALQAFVDHGTVSRTIDSNVSEAEGVYSALEKLGISWNDVGSELEVEGVASFEKSFDSLLDTLQQKANFLKMVSLLSIISVWQEEPVIVTGRKENEREIGLTLVGGRGGTSSTAAWKIYSRPVPVIGRTTRYTPLHTKELLKSFSKQSIESCAYWLFLDCYLKSPSSARAEADAAANPSHYFNVVANRNLLLHCRYLLCHNIIFRDEGNPGATKASGLVVAMDLSDKVSLAEDQNADGGGENDHIGDDIIIAG